ncbi:universal stress protein [Streptomyces avidinii]|uniref:Nucleotide-binding universal stress UspA family protein n=1 Tax=Streptomyces avidinii TaxID=1895 RepID=A0ABS4LFI5_STRAV|nr:universal stress protein [Streptomyces avidinii]MBP2040899.1 nucleotide-binding universal stress UspA family protein [Streptomyces avidinii]GGZ06067.1 hypothetical protein GCM10010343_34940 [Streptomyces avidinii]
MNSTGNGSEFDRVVVGVDGSEPARRAALWAAAEADRRGSPLHIVYAADTEGRDLYVSADSIEYGRGAGRELLDETAAAVADLHPGLHVTTEFSSSAPPPACTGLPPGTARSWSATGVWAGSTPCCWAPSG